MRNPVLAAVCAIALAACGSDSTAPDASTLSFSYTGAGASGTATFSATGDIPANTIGSGGLGTSAWAAGSIDASSNSTLIGAVIPRSSTSWDLASISITRTTVGTSPIDPSCDVESADCTGVGVGFSFQPNGDSFQYFCGVATGTVTITAISTSNIAGTFSGSGTCFNSAFAETPFSVSNGAFNVAVTTQLLEGGGPAARKSMRLPSRHPVDRTRAGSF